MSSDEPGYGSLHLNRDLRVVRFGGDYTPPRPFHEDLEDLVEQLDDLYPGIDIWFGRKVRPGLKSGERVALLVYHNQAPIGATIVRKGTDSKLCSLRVLPEEQNMGIGRLLMSLIAAELRGKAKRIHFTIPKQLWLNKGDFFEDYGFSNDGPAHNQYRLFDQEFACSSDFANVWEAVLRSLPSTISRFTLNGHSAYADLVLSVKPDYGRRIVSGKKKVDVRRRFSERWKGASVWFYASAPQRQLIGEAIVDDVVKGSPERIWKCWRNEIGCSYDEFADYCHNAAQVSVVVFTNIRRFDPPIFMTQIEHLMKQDLTPPQSHHQVKRSTVWPTALALGSLLLRNK